MKINGKEYLSPQEQLFENTKDIEELKQLVKPVYQTTATLTSSSVSVALADTNVGDATEGWLMTTDGLLFKITANDGTTVLLIYYANFKGADGVNAIDDLTTANNKLWSSLKTSNEIVKAKDKGIYFTTTQPTYDSGLYYLDEGYFDNINSDISIKTYDLLIYIDSNDKVKEIYKVLSKTGNNWSLDKIGDVGGGSKLYQHNIMVSNTGFNVKLQIINNSNTQFTTTTLKTWLWTNGFDGNVTNMYLCNGYSTSVAKPINGINASQNSGNIFLNYDEATSSTIASETWNASTIVDTILPL